MVHWFKKPGALGWVVYATLWLLTGSRLGAQPASNTTPCPAPTTGEEKQSAESKGSGEARTNGLDLEAVKKVVREELKAEKEQSKKEEPQWYEVGKNLGMTASWNNGFHAVTADQAFRFHVGGRLEFDNTWFTQDDNLLLGPDADTKLKDGSLFRRARLRADGLVWDWIDFVTEVNFANIQDASNVDDQLVQVGSVGLADFYVTFRDMPYVGNVRVGHFQAPVGLERTSSSNAWYYMERSSLFDAFLGPNNYQNGVMVFSSGLDDRVTWAGAFTRIGKAAVQSFGFDAQDGKYAAAVRLTGLPVYAQDGRVLMHVGVGYQHQALVDHKFTVANRPLLRAGSGGGTDTPNVLSTGTFFSPHGADILDLEWALVYGPFAVSAEYAITRGTDLFERFDGVTFSGPRGNVAYQAWYVEAGWFLTPGDYRRFDKKTAEWARTSPQENGFLKRTEDCGWCCGHGAVQLLARYTYLDLVSGDPVLTPTSGGARAGKQHDITLGLNWYLNSQVWIDVNYIWTHVDSVVAGASGNFQGLGTRLHIDF